MAGDGAGLRRDPHRTAAPYLVPALGDRVVARGNHAPERVERRRPTRELPGARRDEAAGPIVHEGPIVEAQTRTDGRVVLMARSIDGEEAADGRRTHVCSHVDLP